MRILLCLLPLAAVAAHPMPAIDARLKSAAAPCPTAGDHAG